MSLVTSRMPAFSGCTTVLPSAPTVRLLEVRSAEKLAGIYEISREEQDDFALRSHRLAAQAYEDGVMGEVVPVPGVDLERDEGIRADSSLEKLAKLKPAFVEGGTVSCWGGNLFGQLGTGVFSDGGATPLPVDVVGL